MLELRRGRGPELLVENAPACLVLRHRFVHLPEATEQLHDIGMRVLGERVNHHPGASEVERLLRRAGQSS
jgi:hypothetical protein